MEVPSEYNIIGGLLGLGPDILLEILSELKLIPNAVQFLGVCNKTRQLMNHQRFMKIMETLSYPIEIINKIPGDVEFIDIDLVLDNGIWSMEALFQNTYGAAIGIVRDSYDIPAYAFFAYQPHTDHIAAFCGKNYGNLVWYKEQGTEGNAGFDYNQILRLEFDSFKETLILFIDNVQQPVYFSGIKEKVRFIV
ncbi:MAG: hypothetical protein EZS28_007329 [Streblomastix strix]|uniref:Uncharacterized protein n=1 Tax=Streblomastix strix TaxID=222440 RepID=A0A5J4WQ43_9EUKA|nr:MAG: hypothetical protein EZS28_007329 [Streblomastix strix]